MVRLFVGGSLNAVKVRIYGSSVIKTIIREQRFPDNLSNLDDSYNDFPNLDDSFNYLSNLDDRYNDLSNL